MDKRTFLKSSVILGAGGAIAGTFPGSLKAAGRFSISGEDPFKMPELGYAYDALEPHIDAMTMEVHYSKHYAGYTRRFNAAVKEAGLEGTAIKDIFRQVSKFPEGIRNNGGGFWNHRLYWKCMSPDGGGEPEGDLLKALEKNFGSAEKFRSRFSEAASGLFGSGWTWLVNTGNELAISTTPNQDNPLMDITEVQGFPLLALDVWEHAYYLKYQNRRTEYISAFWNVVNWEFVARRFEKSNP